MPTTLSLAYLPLFAEVPVNAVDSICRRSSHLIIFQDKAEASGDRSEWTEGVCGFFHPEEE